MELKLKKLKKIIDKAVKRAGKTDPRVFIYTNTNRDCEILNIGQFTIIPDLTIEIKVLKKTIKEPL